MNLESRVEELETKLAFQEMTVDELNQELVKLNQVIAEQQQLVQLLVGKIKAIEPSNMAGQDEETPPPHY